MKKKKVLIVLTFVLMAIGFTATSSFAWTICGKILKVEQWQDQVVIRFIRVSDSWEAQYYVSDIYGTRLTIMTAAYQAISTDSYVTLHAEPIEGVQYITGIMSYPPDVNPCASE